MKGKKRIIALLLCVLTLVGLMPTAAFAAEQNVTIESQTNSAFDYLEYYSSGGWHDLNTPKHTIEQTGEVAYCVEHSLGNPHGDDYTATSPSKVFSAATLKGLYSIFMYGYPCNTPSGFTADEARQATANAIRFWLSEQGEGSSYNFTNRKTNPDKIRAKDGYEHVLEWADELLEKARAGSMPTHGISMSPANITLSNNGSKYTGTVMVDVLTTDKNGVAKTNVELRFGNYVLKELAVPNENIIMNHDSYPLTLNGDTPEVIHEGYYTDPIMNDMFKANIAIIKSDADKADRMLEGAVYEITNADGKKYCTMTTDADGYAASIDLPVGKYFVRKITPPTGFIVSDEVIEVDVTLDNKATIVYERTNKGNEVVLKKSDITTGKPVAGATIEIYDSEGRTYFEGKADENGEITLKEILAGTYTYKETIAPTGYALNAETFEFTMDHHGKVTGMTEITDEPITLKLTKVNNFTSNGFADVEFTLMNADGTVVKTSMTEDGYRIPDANGSETFKVDAKGNAEFRYLPEGEYKFVENTPIGYISEGEYAFKLTDADSYSKPYSMTVENDPTGLKILKIDAKTGNPLTGAGFRIKMKDGLGFETLTFTQMEDGSYFFDENGTVMDMMVDPSFVPHGSTGHYRAKIDGKSLTEDDIRDYIEKGFNEDKPIVLVPKDRPVFIPYGKQKGFRALYVSWMYVLGIIGKGGSTPYPKANRGDLRRFEQYKQQADYLEANKIDTPEQLDETKQSLSARIDVLTRDRIILNQKKKRQKSCMMRSLTLSILPIWESSTKKELP